VYHCFSITAIKRALLNLSRRFLIFTVRVGRLEIGQMIQIRWFSSCNPSLNKKEL